METTARALSHSNDDFPEKQNHCTTYQGHFLDLEYLCRSLATNQSYSLAVEPLIAS
jgi:hypothetical protein